MATTAEVLRAYMDAAGWKAPDLVRRTGLHKSTVSMLLSGKRGVGMRAAAAIETATVEAYRRRETDVTPLRIGDLVPREREVAA